MATLSHAITGEVRFFRMIKKTLIILGKFTESKMFRNRVDGA